MRDYVPPNARYGVMTHSYEWALGQLETEGSNFVYCEIYGSAGVARYFVLEDGSVKFSARHSQDRVEEARQIGFAIC